MDALRKKQIEEGRTALGIELGSTRIKAVLTGEDNAPLAAGSHEWENRLENGIWTYTLDDIWTGLRDCYKKLAKDVQTTYGVTLRKIGSMGFSAMMHGYMAFDKDGELLVPFRTWRNTMTAEAAGRLTALFSYPIPQMEHCPSLSGNLKQGTACTRNCVSDHACRLCTLETDGQKGTGRRRGVRHVSHRYGVVQLQ